MAIDSSILAGESPWTEEPGRATIESDTTEATEHEHLYPCSGNIYTPALRKLSFLIYNMGIIVLSHSDFKDSVKLCLLTSGTQCSTRGIYLKKS